MSAYHRLIDGRMVPNKQLDIAPHIPFGGATQSGIGPEFTDEGPAEFTRLQIINGAAASA